METKQHFLCRQQQMIYLFILFLHIACENFAMEMSKVAKIGSDVKINCAYNETFKSCEIRRPNGKSYKNVQRWNASTRKDRLRCICAV